MISAWFVEFDHAVSMGLDVYRPQAMQCVVPVVGNGLRGLVRDRSSSMQTRCPRVFRAESYPPHYRTSACMWRGPKCYEGFGRTRPHTTHPFVSVNSQRRRVRFDVIKKVAGLFP